MYKGSVNDYPKDTALSTTATTLFDDQPEILEEVYKRIGSANMIGVETGGVDPLDLIREACSRYSPPVQGSVKSNKDIIAPPADRVPLPQRVLNGLYLSKALAAIPQDQFYWEDKVATLYRNGDKFTFLVQKKRTELRIEKYVRGEMVELAEVKLSKFKLSMLDKRSYIELCEDEMNRMDPFHFDRLTSIGFTPYKHPEHKAAMGYGRVFKGEYLISIVRSGEGLDVLLGRGGDLEGPANTVEEMVDTVQGTEYTLKLELYPKSDELTQQLLESARANMDAASYQSTPTYVDPIQRVLNQAEDCSTQNGSDNQSEFAYIQKGLQDILSKLEATPYVPQTALPSTQEAVQDDPVKPKEGIFDLEEIKSWEYSVLTEVRDAVSKRLDAQASSKKKPSGSTRGPRGPRGGKALPPRRPE